jgi:hypothetical protein
LDPAPPVDIRAKVAEDGKSVTFAWENFLQTSFRETVVQDDNGKALYAGRSTNFVWKSNVDGEAAFRVLSRDKTGRLSRSEPFTLLRLSGLKKN